MSYVPSFRIPKFVMYTCSFLHVCIARCTCTTPLFNRSFAFFFLSWRDCSLLELVVVVVVEIIERSAHAVLMGSWFAFASDERVMPRVGVLDTLSRRADDARVSSFEFGSWFSGRIQ